jgi:hypothetical protein
MSVACSAVARPAGRRLSRQSDARQSVARVPADPSPDDLCHDVVFDRATGLWTGVAWLPPHLSPDMATVATGQPRKRLLAAIRSLHASLRKAGY